MAWNTYHWNTREVSKAELTSYPGVDDDKRVLLLLADVIEGVRNGKVQRSVRNNLQIRWSRQARNLKRTDQRQAIDASADLFESATAAWLFKNGFKAAADPLIQVIDMQVDTMLGLPLCPSTTGTGPLCHPALPSWFYHYGDFLLMCRIW